MKELSKSPLWLFVCPCAALLAGCRNDQITQGKFLQNLNFYAQAGVDATLLGTTAESPKLNLNEVKKTKREPDIDACGAK